MNTQYFFYKEENILKRIKLDGISYLKAVDDYVKIYDYAGHLCSVRLTLDEVLNLLPASQFVKIHRDYAVGLDFIESIRPNSVYIEAGTRLPVSKEYRVGLMEKVEVVGKVAG